MTDTQLQKKMDLANSLASRHAALLDKIRDEFKKRTGRDYNDLDCDSIIDYVEYGQGCLTVEEALKEIRNNFE